MNSWLDLLETFLFSDPVILFHSANKLFLQLDDFLRENEAQFFSLLIGEFYTYYLPRITVI